MHKAIIHTYTVKVTQKILTKSKSNAHYTNKIEKSYDSWYMSYDKWCKSCEYIVCRSQVFSESGVHDLLKVHRVRFLCDVLQLLHKPSPRPYGIISISTTLINTVALINVNMQLITWSVISYLNLIFLEVCTRNSIDHISEYSGSSTKNLFPKPLPYLQ